MSLLDRDLQKNLLNQLSDAYPEPVKGLYSSQNPHSPESVNLNYLAEHGLVKLVGIQKIGPPEGGFRTSIRVDSATITAAGMDFLEEDGGLSAILGTVTVRLHADTIRDLIEMRIAESEAPTNEKRRMIDALKTMPEDSLKHLVTKLIDYSLEKSPGAWQALSSLLS